MEWSEINSGMFIQWSFCQSSELPVNSSELIHLVGLVVRRPPQGWKILGSNPACARIFGGSSHTSDLKIGIPVATLSSVWRYRVSAGTGRPDVGILWLGEMESLICNFYLSVAARKIVWADLFLRYTRMLLGRSATNSQTQTPQSWTADWETKSPSGCRNHRDCLEFASVWSSSCLSLYSAF